MIQMKEMKQVISTVLDVQINWNVTSWYQITMGIYVILSKYLTEITKSRHGSETSRLHSIKEGQDSKLCLLRV